MNRRLINVQLKCFIMQNNLIQEVLTFESIL